MKTILIGPAYPLRGGIANFNESLANTFLKKQIDTLIISFYNQYPAIFFPGKTQYVEKEKKIDIKILPLISSINPLSWKKSAKYILSENPDLVIVQYWMPFMSPAYGSILKSLKKQNMMKVIAIMHNVKPHEKKAGSNQLIKYFVKNCDGFVCLSSSVLNELNEYIENKNKIFVPHPVYDIFGEKVSMSEARNFLGFNSESRIILFFGLIRKYKGLDLLLNTMAIDRVRNLNVKLIVAGEFYDDKNYYIQLIKELRLQDSVIIIDKYIPDDEVKYYFCSADMVVQPYISATQSGITQIAYNFDRPMLVTRVGGLSEIVFDGYTGYVTDINVDAIADAIIDFYSNNREKELSENVKKEKYRFSWDEMVDNILCLYKKIENNT